MKPFIGEPATPDGRAQPCESCECRRAFMRTADGALCLRCLFPPSPKTRLVAVASRRKTPDPRTEGST